MFSQPAPTSPLIDAPAAPLVLIVATTDYHPLVAALAGDYQVQVATPDQAGARLREQRPDLVLCRIAGPDDLSLVQALAAGPLVCALIAADGAAAPALARAALAAGAADYLLDTPAYRALLPFHLRRLSEAAIARRRVQELEDAAAAAHQQEHAQYKRMCRMIHDLRTPLTYLVGYSELLLAREPSPETVKHMANEMLRESQRLTDLLETLHSMVRHP